MEDDQSAAGLTDRRREHMIDRLREYVGTGDLTLAEFEERVQQALAAQTSAELARATEDLPVTAVVRPDRIPARRWLVSVFGGSTTRGRWRVGRTLRSISVFGGSDIDLRGAELDGDELTIVAIAIFGGDEIYVPDSVDVVLTGVALFGGNDMYGGIGRARPGAPLIRVHAYCLFGGVEVYRLPLAASTVSLKKARRLAKGKRKGRRAEFDEGL